MNPAQLGQLVEDHASALVLYARQWSSAPEDVVQEAFLKLAISGTAPANAAAWLFRVVRNQAISELRQARRRREYEARAAEQAPGWFVSGEGEGHDIDAEAAALALKSLPDDEREVITLHLWGKLTFAEIAEVVVSSASTVHRWYLTGLARLREKLEMPCPNILKKN